MGGEHWKRCVSAADRASQPYLNEINEELSGRILMYTVTFVRPNGERLEIAAGDGANLMQLAIENNIEEIVADCGGSMSCATCHVYIEEHWREKAPPQSPMEAQMITCAIDPTEDSRLSCQIHISEILDGLVVTLPESQY
jgi:2Fe-2S ferredoxin